MIDKIKFLELYNQGKSDKELSEIFNRSMSTIYEFRIKNDLPNNRDIYFEKLKSRISELRELDYTDNQIASTLGISQKQVNYFRNKLGLKPKMFQNSYKTKEDKVKGYTIRSIKYSAKRRNIDFDLKYQDLQLPETCPLLGIPLVYNNKEGYSLYNYATVDRIDNSKGYVKGNVWIISRLANAMKNEADFDQLITFSQNITKLIDFYKNQGALVNITDIFPDIILKT